MKQMLFRSPLGIVFLTLFLHSLCGRPASAQEVNLARPNFLLILTDDQELGFEPIMPILARELTDQGMTFTNAFVSTSLCCPSRASLLRGQYAHNHGVLSNFQRGGAPLFKFNGSENSTLATWLNDAGYYTALVGKYMNQYPFYVAPVYPSVPPGWSDWFAAVDIFPDITPYSQFNYQMIRNNTLRSFGSAPSDYFGDVITEYALGVIDSAVSREQPFFLFFNPVSPHTPGVPAPRHAAELPDLEAPRLPSFNELDVSDKPAWLQQNELLSAAQISNIDVVYRRRAQSLLSLDESIEILIDKLSEVGQLENTYIIFTSDNGFHMGEHRLTANKNTAYEEDIRVPFIIRGPGIAEAVSVDAVALNTDIAPTIAELAGVQPPGFVDGRSLVPILSGAHQSSNNWRSVFLVEHFSNVEFNIGRPTPNPYGLEYFALRTNEHLYVEYAYGDQELYDLSEDPYQLVDVTSSASEATLARYSELVASLKNCSADTCRTIEDGDETAICGDANQDGIVTASDALQALLASLGDAECAVAVCDVNTDGTVTATDALLILTGGLSPETPLDCPAR